MLFDAKEQIKGRPQRTSAQNREKLIPSPLVRTGSTPLPPCPCGHKINFEKFEVFCAKMFVRPHLKYLITHYDLAEKKLNNFETFLRFYIILYLKKFSKRKNFYLASKNLFPNIQHLLNLRKKLAK